MQHIIPLSGISSINPRDILLVDNEYLKVTNVGLGTSTAGPITNSGSVKLVEVDRGFVGSSAATHTNSATVFNFIEDHLILLMMKYILQNLQEEILKSIKLNLI